jgi:hypothetical protein
MVPTDAPTPLTVLKSVRFSAEMSGMPIKHFGTKANDATRMALAGLLIGDTYDDDRVIIKKVHPTKAGSAVAFNVGIAPSTAAEREAIIRLLRVAMIDPKELLASLRSNLVDEGAVPSRKLNTVFFDLSCDGIPHHQRCPSVVTLSPTAAPTPVPTPGPTPLKQDCVLTPWGRWTMCTLTCGGGMKSSSRDVETPASSGGKPCGATQSNKACSQQKCGTDCVSTWGKWSACNLPCGGGIRTRRAYIDEEPKNGGEPCIAKQQDPCNIESCAPTMAPSPAPTLAPTQQPTPAPTPERVDCDVSEWDVWSTCSVKCGGGVMHANRTIEVHPSGDGDPCPVLHSVRNCNTEECPRNCQYDWHDWSECSKSCGAGTKTRAAKVWEPQKFGGEPCPEEMHKTCNIEVCPTEAPTPRPTAAPTYNPTPPPTPPPTPAPSPPPTPEPLDCKLSQWSTWGTCSAKCGGGIMARSRHPKVHALFGGKPCPRLKETNVCNTHECDDCKVEWNDWSSCSKSCGGGTMERKPQIVVEPFFGNPCPPVQHKICNEDPCATDAPTLAPTVAPTPEPTPAPSQAPTPAPTPEQPADCVMTQWSSWSECTVRCGGGVQASNRTAVHWASHGGKACPAKFRRHRTCNTALCHRDCKVKWHAWSPCTVTCNGGTMWRAPTAVVMEPANGGKACPHKQYRLCAAKPCPTFAPTPMPPKPPYCELSDAKYKTCAAAGGCCKGLSCNLFATECGTKAPTPSPYVTSADSVAAAGAHTIRKALRFSIEGETRASFMYSYKMKAFKAGLATAMRLPPDLITLSSVENGRTGMAHIVVDALIALPSAKVDSLVTEIVHDTKFVPSIVKILNTNGQYLLTLGEIQKMRTPWNVAVTAATAAGDSAGISATSSASTPAPPPPKTARTPTSKSGASEIIEEVEEEIAEMSQYLLRRRRTPRAARARGTGAMAVAKRTSASAASFLSAVSHNGRGGVQHKRRDCAAFSTCASCGSHTPCRWCGSSYSCMDGRETLECSQWVYQCGGGKAENPLDPAQMQTLLGIVGAISFLVLTVVYIMTREPEVGGSAKIVHRYYDEVEPQHSMGRHSRGRYSHYAGHGDDNMGLTPQRYKGNSGRAGSRRNMYDDI